MAASEIPPALICHVCGDPVDSSSSQICADDEGKSVHIGCYLKQLAERNSSIEQRDRRSTTRIPPKPAK